MMAEQTYIPETMQALHLLLGRYDDDDDDKKKKKKTNLPAGPSPSPSSVIYDTAFPTPKPSPTQYLIRVQAAAPVVGEVARIGTLLCAFSREQEQQQQFPIIPAHEFCGTVISTPTEDHQDANGPRFKVGDEVFGLLDFDRDGAAADYALATEAELALKPRNVSAAEAATIPLSSLTAWQAFFVYAGLDPDDASCNQPADGQLRVLVTNASSDVGMHAIRLLRSHSLFFDEQLGPGCSDRRHPVWVCALGSHDDLESIRGRLGAQAVTASTTDIIAAFRENDWDPVDIVLECMGSPTLQQVHSPAVVKDCGHVFKICEPWTSDDDDQPANRDCSAEISNRELTSKLIAAQPNGRQLERIKRLVEMGELKPSVHSVVDLTDGVEAMRRAEEKKDWGKIVLRVNPVIG
jgi:NADPH:quinone reductase-like Zn-dependent oxidoreductase